ncbi:MAG: phage portal protein, partial [Actinomycetota bacterium]
PLHVIVELDPENRSRRLAAAKAWRDEELGQVCTVYLPDGIYKFRRGRRGWEPRVVDGEEWPVPNRWGVVPVVPILNRPGLLEPSVSEIENILSKQDMINKLLADMVVAAEYGAFRQRWATGVEIPDDSDGDGQPSDEFIAAVNRLWSVTAPDAKFGEFGQTDLDPYVKAIVMLVQHIASQTATPPHYLLNTGVLPSGESLRAAEAPLVAKAKRRQRGFGASWAEVMRLALLMNGRELPAGETITTVWADPESRTESEHVDAVMKMKSLDVPTQQLWELLGFSPQQIERFKLMRVDDALSQLLAAPPASSGVSGSAADASV